MSKAIGLSDYLAKLAHAAGPGAAGIAASVTASGNLQAKTGIAGPQVPGGALRSVLARSSGRSSRRSNATSSAQVPKIANRMAKDALQQGAELLSGNQ
jgi:hypothetical protein